MRVQPNPTRGLYTLLEPLRYLGVIVPEGFEWNGASIPRFVWPIIGYTPFHPRLMRASCVHDYLYTIQKGSRRDADHLFWHILIEDGVPEHAANAMWRAVRNHGHRVWKDEEDLRRAAELAEVQESKADN